MTVPKANQYSIEQSFQTCTNIQDAMTDEEVNKQIQYVTDNDLVLQIFDPNKKGTVNLESFSHMVQLALPLGEYNEIRRSIEWQKVKKVSLSELTRERIFHFHDLFPHLEYLDLSYSKVSNLTLVNFCQWCNDLKVLDVTHCKELSLPGLGRIGHAAKLERLDLGYTAVDCISLSHICKNCTELKILSLKGCREIPSNAMENLSLLSKLEKLDLSGTNIDYETLHEICTKCTDLQKIILSDCPISLEEKEFLNFRFDQISFEFDK